MSDIPEILRAAVVDRAGDRCEYCRLAQAGQEAEFHVDHVQPRAARGPTILENLALACVSCSLRKGAKQTATDPESGVLVALFHPRMDQWQQHFQWAGERLIGLTPTGRATVAAMAMNRSLILEIRKEEATRGRHPG